MITIRIRKFFFFAIYTKFIFLLIFIHFSYKVNCINLHKYIFIFIYIFIEFSSIIDLAFLKMVHRYIMGLGSAKKGNCIGTSIMALDQMPHGSCGSAEVNLTEKW